MKLPSISIITTTYNTNISLFRDSLQSVGSQTYPKELLEHIIVDAGSDNGTIGLAKEYGCDVIIKSNLKKEQEMRASLGISKAKGDLYMILQSDNILTSNNWLERMVEPFTKDKNIVCTYSAYNSYKENMSATTRYCALFGSTDPFLYYLGKSEKIPLIQKIYNKGTIIKETSRYYIVKFDKNNLPTIGDNGHLILKNAIDKVNKNPAEYTHTDAICELVNLGYNTFGVVKNSIIHIANSNILGLIERRVEVKKTFYDERRGRRKYLVFNWNSNKDRISLVKYIIFSITFVFPFWESIKGYTKIRDGAWFLHPIICLLTLIGYGRSELQWFLSRK